MIKTNFSYGVYMTFEKVFFLLNQSLNVHVNILYHYMKGNCTLADCWRVFMWLSPFCQMNDGNQSGKYNG